MGLESFRMTKAEKLRLTELVKDAAVALGVENLFGSKHLEKSTASFSPANFNSFRDVLHGVWLLIALEAYDDAKRLLNALCEVNDDFYWMFEWLGATFATRAWLHFQQGELAASQADGEVVLHWLERDPNAKPLRASEYRKTLERCDILYVSAEKEKSVKSSAGSLCTALIVLVLYQQTAHARTEPEEAHGYEERITATLALLKQKLQSE